MATVEELLEFLPGTDCGQCGLTCREFAEHLGKRELAPGDCPVLHEPDFAGFIEALEELLGPVPAAALGMSVDAEKCTGCGICVTMCEYHLGNCAEARLGRGPRPGDKLVFKVVNGQVAVLRQDLCTRLIQAAEKCAKCADHCPTGAITLT
jgi:Na+-translocating ferredoxin:NAD+ oxidoreductase RNF subunit RnfB